MSRPTTPTSPRRGKLMIVKVLMLDNTVNTFQIPHKASGKVLYEDVVNKLQLLEADYFDLEYINAEGIACWLDHDKPVLKQVGSPHELNFRFGVKFYTPDPGLLEDEYTRYLFALQIKRDLQTGLMPCNENTAALLASYITQAELGDFIDEFTDQSYFNSCKIMQTQTPKLEEKIIDHHKVHVGMTPADADFNLLDTARKVEMYGIKMCSARVSTDHEACGLNLATAHMGVLVFQNYTKINTFSWAKIRKLSFKRKKFLIKLHPEGYFQLDFTAITEGFYKDTVEFYFETRNECKNFWKKCIEHHAFFRCQAVKRLPRNKTRVVSRGSSFRYGGRTQKQLVEWVRENHAKRVPFDSSDRRQTTTSASARASSRNDSTRTNTLNSADLHHSHNSTSSGSHTLDATYSKDNLDRVSRVETVDIHSSHSSVGSPKRHTPDIDRRSLDRRSIDSRRERERSERSLDRRNGKNDSPLPPPPPPPPPPPLQDEQVSARKCVSLRNDTLMCHVRHDVTDDDVFESDQSLGPIPQARMGAVGLERKYSEPVLSQTEQRRMQRLNNAHLARSPECENIPDEVYHSRKQQRLVTPPDDMNKFQRSFSDNPPLPMDSSTPRLNGRHPPPKTPTRTTPVRPFEPPRSPDDVFDGRSARTPDTRSLGNRTPARTPGRSPTDDCIVFSAPRAASPEPIAKPQGPVVRQETAAKTVGNFVDSSFTLQRYPSDKSYYIAKELLMGERTYKKDLEVLTVWFRNMVCRDGLLPDYLVDLIFSHLDTIYENHCIFLKDLEQRMATWEGKTNILLSMDHRKVGDLLLGNMKMLQLYRNYISKLEEILTELDRLVRQNKHLEQVYKEFESQKVCYLPLNTFLLKPTHRLLHYQVILDRLLKHYPQDHPDYRDCKVTLSRLVETTEPYTELFTRLENLQKMLELQRDLIGIEHILQPNRVFIREGCLQKLSKKGYQQRMFFLFSDIVVYTSRTTTPSLQFKVHGQLPLDGMTIEEPDPNTAVASSFTVYAGHRCLVVAASGDEEKERWLRDITQAIADLRDRTDGEHTKYPRLKSGAGSFDDLDGDVSHPPTTPPMSEKQIQHRANTTMHVCWHRNTSVSMHDHHYAVKNQLSGYVLRKFKNTNGWQKLWVVFTNFCLFFYKTFQDDFPLASLPLLGYSVGAPEAEDAINKDFVFKLRFKNHVYFFRAESQYTYERWMEVIGSATNTGPLDTRQVMQKARSLPR